MYASYTSINLFLKYKRMALNISSEARIFFFYLNCGVPTIDESVTHTVYLLNISFTQSTRKTGMWLQAHIHVPCCLSTGPCVEDAHSIKIHPYSTFFLDKLVAFCHLRKH